jgi:hypothetical protein
VKTYPAKETLDEVMKANPNAINDSTKRVIIYTAMIVAGSDGYVLTSPSSQLFTLSHFI